MGGGKAAYLNVIPDATLVFFGPFDRPKLTSLRLHNASPHRVAFKLKTDVPLLYKVLPKTGFIEPGTQILVEIMLRAFDERCLYQSALEHFFAVFAHPAMFQYEDPDDFWRENEFRPESVQKKKIPVIIQPLETKRSSMFPFRKCCSELGKGDGNSLFYSPSMVAGGEALPPGLPADWTELQHANQIFITSRYSDPAERIYWENERTRGSPSGSYRIAPSQNSQPSPPQPAPRALELVGRPSRQSPPTPLDLVGRPPGQDPRFSSLELVGHASRQSLTLAAHPIAPPRTLEQLEASSSHQSQTLPVHPIDPPRTLELLGNTPSQSPLLRMHPIELPRTLELLGSTPSQRSSTIAMDSSVDAGIPLLHSKHPPSYQEWREWRERSGLGERPRSEPNLSGWREGRVVPVALTHNILLSDQPQPPPPPPVESVVFIPPGIPSGRFDERGVRRNLRKRVSYLEEVTDRELHPVLLRYRSYHDLLKETHRSYTSSLPKAWRESKARYFSTIPIGVESEEPESGPQKDNDIGEFTLAPETLPPR